MSNTAIGYVSFWQQELMLIFYITLQLKSNKSGSCLIYLNLKVMQLQDIYGPSVLEKNSKLRVRLLDLLCSLREEIGVLEWWIKDLHTGVGSWPGELADMKH